MKQDKTKFYNMSQYYPEFSNDFAEDVYIRNQFIKNK